MSAAPPLEPSPTVTFAWPLERVVPPLELSSTPTVGCPFACRPSAVMRSLSNFTGAFPFNFTAVPPPRAVISEFVYSCSMDGALLILSMDFRSSSNLFITRFVSRLERILLSIIGMSFSNFSCSGVRLEQLRLTLPASATMLLQELFSDICFILLTSWPKTIKAAKGRIKARLVLSFIIFSFPAVDT